MKLSRFTIYVLDVHENNYPALDMQNSIEQDYDDYGIIAMTEAETVEVDIDQENFHDSKWDKSDLPLEEFDKEFKK